MGLKGQLEDLPLLDMLQIIAFSKKSGYLRVSGPPGRGAVMLRDGRVLFSYSWSTAGTLRELGGDPSSITPEVIRQCIEGSLRDLGGLREGSFEFELTDSIGEEIGGVRIQPFLLEHGLDPQELLLDLAVDLDNERRETTSLLELAFRGSDLPGEEAIPDVDPKVESFEADDAAIALGLARDPEPEPGAGPEPPPPTHTEPEPEPALAREPAVEAPRPRPAPAPASAPDPPGRRASLDATVILVDDEQPVLDVVGRELARRGHRVQTAGSPRRGAELVKARCDAGETVLVVVDLKMPTTSGRSFYGGFELVRKTPRWNGGAVPVLLMVESLSEKAKARAKALGVRRVVHKPTLTKIDPELYRQDLQDFASVIEAQLEKLVEDLETTPRAPSATQTETPSPSRAEAERQAPLPSSPSSTPDPRPMTVAPGREASQMELLARMTRKLVDPKGSEDVSRLVMDVAARFLERGILFVVKADLARGLTGFGIEGGTEASTLLAKRVVIDIGSCKPMAEVVRAGAPYRPTGDLSMLEGPIFSRVGRARANEGIFIPLLYNRATILVLYGDNAASGAPIGDLSQLELFMAQAGMALENKLLQQKLGAAASAGGPAGTEDTGMSAS